MLFIGVVNHRRFHRLVLKISSRYGNLVRGHFGHYLIINFGRVTHVTWESPGFKLNIRPPFLSIMFLIRDQIFFPGLGYHLLGHLIFIR